MNELINQFIILNKFENKNDIRKAEKCLNMLNKTCQKDLTQQWHPQSIPKIHNNFEKILENFTQQCIPTLIGVQH